MKVQITTFKSVMKKSLTLIVLLFGVNQSVFANAADCLSAYQNNKFKDAYTLCKPVAREDDADAQYILGRIYEEGNIVKKNASIAFQWYKKAAMQGHMGGQYYLGHMYYEGLGVDRDYKQAYKWTLKAVNQDFFPAYYNLGLMYQYGEGVEKNENKALKLYEKAALGGDAAAQFAYGVFILQGKGIKKNAVEGYAWVMLAAERGASHAQKNMNYIKEHMVSADDAIKANARLQKIRSQFAK